MKLFQQKNISIQMPCSAQQSEEEWTVTPTIQRIQIYLNHQKEQQKTGKSEWLTRDTEGIQNNDRDDAKVK